MLDEILKKRQDRFLNAYFDRDSHIPAPVGLERVEMHGIHREPKAGTLQKQGNRMVPPAYKFIGGKRVSTARTHRFAAR